MQGLGGGGGKGRIQILYKMFDEKFLFLFGIFVPLKTY